MLSENSEAGVILIAERDQNVRKLQAFFLEQAGYRVQFVDDGVSALECAIESPPSAIVTEILIPAMDGLTLCRRLREEPRTRDVPVVVFSILAAGKRASEAGARAFLRKPLVDSTFVGTIRELVAARSTEKVGR